MRLQKLAYLAAPQRIKQLIKSVKIDQNENTNNFTSAMKMWTYIIVISYFCNFSPFQDNLTMGSIGPKGMHIFKFRNYMKINSLCSESVYFLCNYIFLPNVLDGVSKQPILAQARGLTLLGVLHCVHMVHHPLSIYLTGWLLPPK